MGVSLAAVAAMMGSGGPVQLVPLIFYVPAGSHQNRFPLAGYFRANSAISYPGVEAVNGAAASVTLYEADTLRVIPLGLPGDSASYTLFVASAGVTIQAPVTIVLVD